MSIPSTVYIALGAAAAALIAGWSSTTNIIIAKDQKISEFRQKWIDELREATSDLICNFAMLSSAVHFHIVSQSEQSEETKKKHVSEAMFKHGHSITLQCTKIRLLLNPNDDVKILSALTELENTQANVVVNLADIDNIDKLLINFETQIKELLKTEWERVKAGEPDYQKYKKASELYPIVLCLLVLVAVLISQFVHA